ncbi:phage tail protein I [Leucothrix sargassi]|nr:phage tail protein I [Leucothrix sargassi]
MFNHLLDNHTPVELALEQVAGQQIEALPILVRALNDPDNCPADLLPWLAWALSVDHWSTDWSEERKREVCRVSRRVHRHKGTLGAVTAALGALDITLQIIEPKDREPAEAVPHQLLVNAFVDPLYLQAESASASVLEDITRIIKFTAPARCSFELELAIEWLQEMQLIVTMGIPLKIRTTEASTPHDTVVRSTTDDTISAVVTMNRPTVFRSIFAETQA